MGRAGSGTACPLLSWQIPRRMQWTKVGNLPAGGKNADQVQKPKARVPWDWATSVVNDPLLFIIRKEF